MNDTVDTINTLDKVKKLLEQKFEEYQKEEIFSGSEYNFNNGEQYAIEEIYTAIFGKEEFKNFAKRFEEN